MQGPEGKTYLAEDVEVTGSIQCSSPIEIHGTLNGDLTCQGTALIGTTAHIKGNLNVENLTVQGEITGNIHAKDRIELKASARLTGDLRARRLVVEEGVTFVGKSEVNPAAVPAAKAGGTVEPQPAPEMAAPPEETQARDVRSRPGGLFGRK